MLDFTGFYECKNSPKLRFILDSATGENVIISTQAGGACYSKGFKASHKAKTMEKMRFAQ